MKTSETNQQKGPDAPQASENTEVEEDANVEMAGGESNGGDTASGGASAFRGSGKCRGWSGIFLRFSEYLGLFSETQKHALFRPKT